MLLINFTLTFSSNVATTNPKAVLSWSENNTLYLDAGHSDRVTSLSWDTTHLRHTRMPPSILSRPNWEYPHKLHHASECQALQRIARPSLPSLLNIFNDHWIQRATRVIRDTSHPSHSLSAQCHLVGGSAASKSEQRGLKTAFSPGSFTVEWSRFSLGLLRSLTFLNST